MEAYPYCDEGAPMNLETTRRRFMQLAAAAATSLTGTKAQAATRPGYVEIKIDSAAELTKASSVVWAIDQLRSSLRDQEIPTLGSGRAAAAIVIAPLNSPLAAGFSLPVERKPEMVALIPSHDRENLILVSGVDARGLTYGLLD